MASLPGIFNIQEFTDAGLPLASGRVYTYEAGTSTLKTAYTDAAAAVAHTYTSDGVGGQFIQLDARGELPAPLYLTSGAYDITLKRADGSTIWTRAGITGIPDATPTAAIDPRVEPYNAVGNGTTDDTAAFQAALDVAAATGASILLPAGTFSISYINVKNGCRGIVGMGGTFKLQNVVNAGIRLLGQKGGEATDVQNCELRSLRIDANSNSNDAVCIWGQNCTNVHVVDNKIFNLAKGYGILLRNYTVSAASGGGNTIIGNRVAASSRNTAGATADLWGIAVDAEAIYGAYADAPEQWKQSFSPPTAQQYNAGNIISGNRVVGGYYGFSLHGLVDSIVSGNNTQNNQRGISLQNQSNGNVVTGNKVFENYSSGIHMAYGSCDNLIEANRILTSVGKGEALIQAYVGCKRNQIQGNQITSNEATRGNNYGIYVAVHADGNIIKNNTVSGRYYRGSIAVESAWRTTLTGIQWHYGNLADPVYSDNYANAPTANVVIEGNTIYVDTVTACPPIYLGQVQTIVTGTAGYTSAYDAALTGTVLRGNTCIAGTATLNSLYLYENTSGSLSGVVAKGNAFSVPDTAMSIATLATYIVLPRGRAHFAQTEGNWPLDRNNSAIQTTGTTPNVGGAYYYGCTNGGSTTIGSLLGGSDGQEIRLRLDVNTGVTHSGGGAADSIRLANATTITAGTATSDTWLELRRLSGVWLEVARSAQTSGSATQSYVLSETTSAISCANNADTAILWDTPSVDTLTEYSAGSGTFTAINAGTYLCAAHTTSEAKTWPLDTRWELRLYVNGSTRMRGQASFCQVAAGSAINGMFSSISVPVKLAASDTVQFRMYQNQGGAVTFNGNARDNWMSIARVA